MSTVSCAVCGKVIKRGETFSRDKHGWPICPSCPCEPPLFSPIKESMEKSRRLLTDIEKLFRRIVFRSGRSLIKESFSIATEDAIIPPESVVPLWSELNNIKEYLSLPEIERICKNCGWWEFIIEVNNDFKVGQCYCVNFRTMGLRGKDRLNSFHDAEMDTVGKNPNIETGESFGCVHWKEKD